MRSKPSPADASPTTRRSDPALIQGLQGLSQAVQAVGQNLVQEKASESQQSLQFLGQMMQGKQ